MKLSKFKYKLPPELIALHPTPNRDEARLMVLDRKAGKIEHKVFKDVIDYFDEKDVFVFNDSKVFPARLYGNKEKTGAEIEVFLLRELNPELRIWDVLVDPARKICIGNKLPLLAGELYVSCSMVNMTSSRRNCMRWAKPRFLVLLTGRWNRRMPRITKLFLPGMKVRWQPRLRVCILAAS